jgi:predicted nicotinamide N-methyase
VVSSPITLLVPPATLPLLFAHRQWRAGLLLSDFLLHSASSSIVGDKRVLELGAGTGLPSICAARAGAASVVCTDYAECGLVARLRENVARNAAATAIGTRVSVAGHTWGKGIDDLLDLLPASQGRAEGADVVLLADCL